MKVIRSWKSGQGRRQCGFSLVEALVSVAILAVVLVTIFGLLDFNLSATRLCRENARATQILLDKMECLRLYQWPQLTNPAVLLTTFTNWSYESTNAGLAGGVGQGAQYLGNITITTPAPALAGTTYCSNLALVTVAVSWNSGNTNLTHTRSMSTYFSRVGMENTIQSN